jgi:hypothetical protein
MSWRNSPFFEQQFQAITAHGGVSAEDIGYILNESDDEPLLVLAKGLEKRGDSRAQYIRDMCELTLGEVRSIAPLFDRVIAFERSLNAGANCFYHSIGEYTFVTLNVAEKREDECVGNVRPELLEFAGSSTANRKVIVDLGAVSYMMSEPDTAIELLAVLRDMHIPIREGSGQFRVLIGTEIVRRVLMVCGMDGPLFRVAADIDEAIDLSARLTSSG